MDGKIMLGAIIGDIVGSRFEFNNYRKKDFEFFSKECFFTDDSIMSLAIAKALMESKKDYSDLKEKVIYYMQTIGRNYPDCGYGLNFFDWIFYNPKPYNSFGNGAAMRISAVGFLSKDLEEAVKLSDIVTGVSHNHPEGIKGARAIACCIYLARTGKSKEEINKYIESTTIEGLYTLKSIKKLLRNKKIKMPIIDLIYDIIINDKEPSELKRFLIEKE